jgi:hypothetical protein
MKQPQTKTTLKRQLQKLGLSEETLPKDLNTWTQFLKKIEKTYSEYNEARISSENVLDVSLLEMERLQAELSTSNQRRLLELNAHLNLILHASDLGTWDWDLESNLVKFNDRWSEMIGLAPKDHPQSFEVFSKNVHPDDLPRVIQTANDYLAGSIPKFEINFRMLHQNGHWIDIFAKGKIINFDLAGKPLRFMGTHLDLTEEKRMQREIEYQRVKLIHTAKLASLGEMSAGIAHEINNPLAIIEGSLGLLPSFIGHPEKFKDKLNFIKKSCNRISRIVAGLRKFSRTGDRSNLQIHSLCKIVEESILLTESKAKKHNARVTCECDQALHIQCDEIEMEQVIVNLINNAIDANKNQEQPWVRIYSRQSGGFIILRVVDSGSGISPSIAEKIFDPFFTTKCIGEGTGLGLSITKGILDEHEAQISLIQDEPNTCFEIRFPTTNLNLLESKL